MVRVITVHHFVSQHIQTVEQPTACTVAPPQRLLLALSSHCIEVRDLKSEADLLFTFPTVDQVTKLVHCLNGDYIATVETKFNRQNREMNYVRVYVNWDSVATLQQSKMTNSGASLDSSECGMVQPMRARIAGRVTPTTNQSELGSLEMIEIPVRQNPSTIECCQISGNILIQSERNLTIYTFHVKTHDISKLRFVDFEELPMYIEMSFVPLQIGFCENYIACLNKDSMHMFKIKWKPHKNSEETKNSENCDTNLKFNADDVTINYKELLKKEMTYSNSKNKITVNLPSIVKGNSIIHKHSPFTFIDKEMNANIRYNFSVDEKSHNCELIHLIQLKLKPIMIENSQTQIMEEFKCLLLRPLYFEGHLKKNDTSDCHPLLRSNYRDCLSDVVCVISTLQEGYLFQFCDFDTDTNIDHCISVYPFTSPIIDMVLEGHLLHALTESGLETYTVRIGHKLARDLEVIDDLNVACPSVEDLICLIGLRLFLGIERILLADNYLVLLANSDNSPTHSVGSNSSSNASFWTLYNLELPTPKMIFNDIAIVANVHRFSSPQTYCHLISEAHTILRLALLLIKWSISDGSVRNVTPSKHNIDDIIEAYRTSCALLGDHFIMCLCEKDYVLCLPYYKMAGMTSFEVLKRFKKVQEESNAETMKGILYYLKMALSGIRLKSEPDFKVAWKQNFIEEILMIFENHNFSDLANLVLKNTTLREYSTSKFIHILLHQTYSDPNKETERLLSLAVLYVQECNIEEAENVIKCIISNSILYKLLLENWELLFEFSPSTLNKHKTGSFSEFSVILMSTNGDILADTFVSLILDKKITLHKILKMFLAYLPLRTAGSDSTITTSVMQKTLEQYFKNYFANYEIKDLPKFASEHLSSAHEAMKILVRSYLSQLQLLQLKESNMQSTDEHERKQEDVIERTLTKDESEPETLKYNHISRTQFPDRTVQKQFNDEFLFVEFRHRYLDKMPPFEVEITSKLYEMCIENYIIKDTWNLNLEADLILRKLQALFCSQAISKQIIMEADTFLALNETLRGRTSLQSIFLGVDEAVQLLLDACPQCLLQYGKDRFTTNGDWKFLINSLQGRIVKLSQDTNLNRVCFFHKKLLKDILTHLAITLHIEQLQQVLPERNTKLSNMLTHDYHKSTNDCLNVDACDCKDDILNEIYCYDSYVTVCRETMQANQIKKLITTTGQQLLCTLNL